MRPDGYIEVWLSPDDFFFPMASSHKGHVLEHRLVMAKHLNRCLLSWEIVYHKNGDKKDNRLENLQVLKGRANHLASIHMQGQINKQQKEIEILKGRITLLEAENVLLKPEYSIN